MKNVELKAKVNNVDEIEKKVKELSNFPVAVINQHDIFFNLPITQINLGGNLKLRKFKDGTGELIFYQRPNIKGPKLSNYFKVQLDYEKYRELKQILTVANGILGIVEKTRHLYIIDQTRIHIDYVFGLGTFVELELILNDNDNPKIGEEIVMKQMIDLGISENSLISGTYLDIMKQ